MAPRKPSTPPTSTPKPQVVRRRRKVQPKEAVIARPIPPAYDNGDDIDRLKGLEIKYRSAQLDYIEKTDSNPIVKEAVGLLRMALTGPGFLSYNGPSVTENIQCLIPPTETVQFLQHLPVTGQVDEYLRDRYYSGSCTDRGIVADFIINEVATTSHGYAAADVLRGLINVAVKLSTLNPILSFNAHQYPAMLTILAGFVEELRLSDRFQRPVEGNMVYRWDNLIKVLHNQDSSKGLGVVEWGQPIVEPWMFNLPVTDSMSLLKVISIMVVLQHRYKSTTDGFFYNTKNKNSTDIAIDDHIDLGTDILDFSRSVWGYITILKSALFPSNAKAGLIDPRWIMGYATFDPTILPGDLPLFREAVVNRGRRLLAHPLISTLYHAEMVSLDDPQTLISMTKDPEGTYRWYLGQYNAMVGSCNQAEAAQA